jgi:hypothetical protein
MKNCQACHSAKIASVSGKCSDLFSANFQGGEYEGYVPSDIGIGGDDYLEFSYCLTCGQIQGTFPVTLPDWPVPKRR